MALFDRIRQVPSTDRDAHDPAPSGGAAAEPSVVELSGVASCSARAGRGPMAFYP